MSKLPLTALATFEVAARKNTFVAAADVLHVTSSAVSRQIRSLENRLGYALFDRSGKTIRLTERGAMLLPTIQSGFSELRRAVEVARHFTDSRRLSLTMLASFLQRWLLPRLHDFQTRNPTIDLRFSTSSQIANFVDSDFDAGIRLGGGRWKDLKSIRIFDEWLVPVARPELVKRIGLIDKKSMISKLSLLHAEDEPWSIWINAAFGQDIALPAGPRMDDSIGVLVAAERGQGIALARWSLVNADVASGRLALAASTAITFHRTYYFVAPPAKYDLPAVRAFRDWLVDTGRRVEPPPVTVLPRHAPRADS
jgi:LysR family glycine cleavage system transcriptional activator